MIVTTSLTMYVKHLLQFLLHSKHLKIIVAIITKLFLSVVLLHIEETKISYNVCILLTKAYILRFINILNFSTF